MNPTKYLCCLLLAFSIYCLGASGDYEFQRQNPSGPNSRVLVTPVTGRFLVFQNGLLTTAIGGTGDALTTGTLAQFATTTSAQLRSVLSDESGTGVFLTVNGSAAALTDFPTFNQSTTGNAASATALQTGRLINGVTFDGTGNITITAAAGTLSGTTLNSSIVNSSLTTLGTVVTGTWNGTAVADSYIASASAWNAKESALTFNTGLTRVANTVTVNSSQSISTLSNLTSNGFVKTSGGTGALSVDTTSYQPLNSNLTTFAGIAPSANIQTFLGAADYAAARLLLLPSIAGNAGLFLRVNAGATDYELAPAGDALTSGTLAQFAVTTSAQLRGVMTDESGTGEFLTTNGSAAALTSFPTFNQSTTGNAATATALQTGRLINGVTFDGTSDITVTSAAGTLTGTTLNSTVTASSLTSLGTVTTGVWNGTAVADSYVASSSTWNAKQAPLGLSLSTAAILPATSGGRDLGAYNQGFGMLRVRNISAESGSGNSAFSCDQSVGVSMGNAAQLGWTDVAAGVGANSTYFTRQATNVIQFDADINGDADDYTLKTADGITGTDRSAGDLHLSTGTSTGAGHAVVTVSTSAAGSTGTTIRSAVERLRISSDGLQLHAGAHWAGGTSSPEGVVTALPGSFFSRTDGAAGTAFYVKESGASNTGWQPIPSVATLLTSADPTAAKVALSLNNVENTALSTWAGTTNITQTGMLTAGTGSTRTTFTATSNGVTMGCNVGHAFRYSYGSGSDTVILSSWQANNGHVVIRGPEGSGGNTNRQGYALRVSPGESSGNAAATGVSLWAAPAGSVSGTTAVPSIRVLDIEAASATRGDVRINGTSGALWTSSTGSPESVIAAPVGSFFSRTDGAAGTAFYLKETGSSTTGWHPVLTTSGDGSSLTGITQSQITGLTTTSRPQFANVQITHSVLTYAATTNIDMDTDGFQTVSLTGDITFTTSNRAAGRSRTVRILCDATPRTFTFPAGWTFMGAAAPASIAASKDAVLTITAFGTADSDIVAVYSVEP